MISEHNTNAVNRRPYVRKQSAGWWLDKQYYFLYMLREGTSLVLAVYAIMLATGVMRLIQGPLAWQGWVETVTSSLAIPLHLLMLVALFYHTLTWFRLAPRIVVIRVGGKALDPVLVERGHWVACVVTTLLLMLLWGGAQ
ncbi:fumarate reductase subunit C [Aestuariirhabdus litorea]|uniref:Fumarate reductase subunit C n=1 Tax=Aestuariirhabdus litorea TaxID=2528527 RepID=A0A3P3VL74_9GAMM|nr:fumarate reductase subunit C [Aestuariirhabdus litorea]RRJ83077.1 fumarate reductase subunit C [Aestuariirhabdus litorea]RWW93235.1 fumarate reductase subunit C [Endozoicomonadaceae bacterium GTF-13]